MKGPDYTIHDLLFWGGVIAGAAVSYPFTSQLEIHPLLRGLLSLGIGWVVGFTADRIYTTAVSKPKSPEEEQRDKTSGFDE
jgi:hypothetical protein